jgi:signal transduction histidine kinase/AmiR/NasT family two-component response regulator
MDDRNDMVSRRAFERERSARKEAEHLLEDKAQELWHRSEQLRALNEALDQRVAERTAELELTRAAAMAANRAKSDFLANMSHEIRTPMTAILGFVELLENDADIAESPLHRGELIATIKRNGEHLLAIINDILDLSKIEAGKMSIESRPTNLDSLIREIMELMRRTVDAKGLAMHVACEHPVPRVIRTDAIRLRQILLNLLSNAVKFTDSGEIGLRIAFTPERESGVLTIDVTDTGIGLTAAQISRLFAPFEQADTSTTRRFGGTGLGLNISRRLASLLGGELDVTSEKDRGSTFTLTLRDVSICGEATIPAGPFDWSAGPAATATDTKEPDHTASASTSQPLKGLRILLAEDGLDNQRLIQHHLCRAGADLVIHANGRLALDSLTTDATVDGPLREADLPHLIITDMQMPELDGYSFARQLRSKGWTNPIIALTAHAMAGDAERCLLAGCDHYLTKPIDWKRLISLCAAARTRRSAAA